MDQALTIVVLAVVAIALVTMVGNRLGVASPLLLLAVGGVVGLMPFVPAIEVEPEWILAGVLPPLLYSAAVSMPAIEFRRELRAISGLSVVLVLASALVLGWFFTLVVPGLSYAWGVALGAIMSPTDAVATSIVKRFGISPRVVAILEGEGLLNDATALVLLRASVAAAATGWSVGGIARDFAVAVVVAVAIGFVVGRVNLWLRARTLQASVNTALSLAVPFTAALPAEHLGASGLVAAVVAGLVTGRGAPRVLSPQHRLSDAEVWRTVEVLLEGAIFLVMGLELFGLLVDLDEDDHHLGRTVAVAAAALVIVLLVRAAFVAPLLLALSRRARRGAAVRDRVDRMRELAEDPDRFAAALTARARKHTRGLRGASRVEQLRLEPERIERFGVRVRRRLADIDYLIAEPLGPREGAVVVWAGLRGAVTLAAAQTLPADTPDRSLLVFLGFLVAAGSLVGQGATIGWVVRRVRPAGVDQAALDRDRVQLVEVLRATAERIRNDAEAAGEDPVDRADVIDAQRGVLLDLAREGAFASSAVRDVMAVLDADQISIELRRRPVEDV